MNKPKTDNYTDAMYEPTPGGIDIRQQIYAFRRRLPLFVGIVILILISGIALTLLQKSLYTASAEVMLDTRKNKITDVQAVLSDLPMDTTAVDTEVEVLKSRDLAEKVVDNLRLQDNPEFNPNLRDHPPLSGFFGVKKSVATTPTEVKSAAIGVLQHHLKVTRLGLTYVIQVSYTSSSPKFASLIANSYANNYLNQQLDAKFDATQRASQWLNSRLGALKGQVDAAEAAVANYKANHGLVAMQSAEGSTIAQQELSTINTQLATAKAQQAEADANLSTAQEQMAKGSTGDDVAASLNSPVINQLRQQRAQVSSELADMSGRLGPRHPDMLKAQRQLSDIDGQISSEIKRILSNLQVQSEVARQRTASLERSSSSARQSLASNGTASVQLSDLQRTADSLTTLYQTYLDRFKQTSTQQGMETTDARIVSAAQLPDRPSSPNILLNLLVTLAAALGAGFASVLLAEALDDGLYTAEDVERFTGVSSLPSIPLLRHVGANAEKGPVEYVLQKPLSAFSEAFRHLRSAISTLESESAAHVIAISSGTAGAGKTTTAICLSRVCALGGSKTILVDCDLRRRSVDRIISSPPTLGMLDVLSGDANLDDAIIIDPESGAKILPVGAQSHTTKDVFQSPAMITLIASLRDRFDLVILDTAPILALSDTKTIALLADATIIVADWRWSSKKVVQNAVNAILSVGGRVAGVTLNRVDVQKQAKYSYGDPSSYYHLNYGYYSAD